MILNSALVIGRDGLYIKKGWNSGVFLPQVPVEQKWNKGQYLDHLLMKAGLPADTYKTGGYELKRFEGVIIE